MSARVGLDSDINPFVRGTFHYVISHCFFAKVVRTMGVEPTLYSLSDYRLYQLGYVRIGAADRNRTCVGFVGNEMHGHCATTANKMMDLGDLNPSQLKCVTLLPHLPTSFRPIENWWSRRESNPNAVHRAVASGCTTCDPIESGTPGRIRTDTERVLSALTLPLVYGCIGGDGGIRTHGGRVRTPQVFKTSAIDQTLPHLH